MKHGLASLIFALTLAAFAAIAAAACSGDDSSAGPDASDDVSLDGAAICDLDLFFDAGGSGGSCPMVSPVRCFPCGDAGGCYCQPGAGGPKWRCYSDPDCVPDSGPRYDSGDDGATGDDGGGTSDAADAGDAAD
jgi:hypothetical protein